MRCSKRSAESAPWLASRRSSQADMPMSLAKRSTSSSPQHLNSASAEPVLIQSCHHCEIALIGDQLRCPRGRVHISPSSCCLGVAPSVLEFRSIGSILFDLGQLLSSD